jgi:hypothetical protein
MSAYVDRAHDFIHLDDAQHHPNEFWQQCCRHRNATPCVDTHTPAGGLGSTRRQLEETSATLLVPGVGGGGGGASWLPMGAWSTEVARQVE